jgi:hypothetical protein
MAANWQQLEFWTRENRKDKTLQYGKTLHGLGLLDDVYWREGSLKAI